MNGSTTWKTALLTLAAAGALCGATTSARAGVAWSVDIGLPGAVVAIGDRPAYRPVPRVYAAPPVAYAPVPVYAPPPVIEYAPVPIGYGPPSRYYRPAPVVYAPPVVVYPGFFHPRRHGWEHRRDDRWEHGDGRR